MEYLGLLVVRVIRSLKNIIIFPLRYTAFSLDQAMDSSMVHFFCSLVRSKKVLVTKFVTKL